MTFSSGFSERACLTLTDWRRAVLGRYPVLQGLRERATRIALDSPPEVWITRVDPAMLEARIAELDALARQHADPAALLRSMPLFGVPFAVKDNIDVPGLPTTAACPAFSRMPQRCATVVRSLLDAGAVLLGKTNLDQFATGLVGARSPYGAPSSVFSPAHVSGGSSAGSAVAVARGDVAFALGTDTAGSGRVPAGFNNIVGLKPTPGRVSTAGVLPACRSVDCVSVFALEVADAAAVLSVIEGPDAADEFSVWRPGPAAWNRAPRVGLPSATSFEHQPDYEQPWGLAIERIEACASGLEVIDFSPLFAVARLLYDGPWVAERYAVVQSLLDESPDALDPTVAAVIGRARSMTAVDTFRAQYQLMAARQALSAIWDDVDVLMVPTVLRHPTHAQLAADPVGVNSQLGVFTNFVNLLGWCALSMPASLTSAGLPFGVTFIGPPGYDAALAHWAREWERMTKVSPGAIRREVPANQAASAGLALGDGLAAQRQPDSSQSPLPIPAAEPVLPLAVVGAHLSGLALNSQLLERRGVLRERTRSAASYRLYALPGTVPPKPGMLRVAEGGCSIELEVWDLPLAEVGSFLALIAPPLGLGSLELADGRFVHGFVCEPWALKGARDISDFGGWRAYLASLGPGAPSASVQPPVSAPVPLSPPSSSTL